MDNILIIDTDLELAESLKKVFTDEENNTCAYSVDTIEAAQKMMSEEKFDVVIATPYLGEMSVLELIKKYRFDTFKKNNTCVILMLASHADREFYARSEYAIDDFIAKPFSKAVLKARVGSLLKKKNRYYNLGNTQTARFSAIGSTLNSTLLGENKYIIDDYMFDFERMVFMRGNESISLNKTEQRLLSVLVDNHGVVLEKNALIERIWIKCSDKADERILKAYIESLIKKLSANDYIRTVYGVGYIWDDRRLE